MPEKLLKSGSWNADTDLTTQGGQLMHFKVKNVNLLGTTLTISADSGDTVNKLILPQTTADFSFPRFGNEPQGWKFDISTDSDAFVVTWELYSTWVPGDPPNPPTGAQGK